MKLIYYLAVISLAACCFGAEHTEHKPGGPSNECHTEVGVGVLKVGESKQMPNDCGVVVCQEADIVYKSCGTVAYDEHTHKLVSDKSKPYPECCPKPVPV